MLSFYYNVWYMVDLKYMLVKKEKIINLFFNIYIYCISVYLFMFVLIMILFKNNL